MGNMWLAALFVMLFRSGASTQRRALVHHQGWTGLGTAQLLHEMPNREVKGGRQPTGILQLCLDAAIVRLEHVDVPVHVVCLRV